MAFVILSAGASLDSRLRTVRMRTLVAATGALALTLMLGGLAVGLSIGSGTAGPERLSGPPPLDATRPGDLELIQQIATLSGRLMRLEAEAARLTERVGAPSASVAQAPGPTEGQQESPAGGPLLDPTPDFAPEGGASLFGLDRQLDILETDLGRVAAAVARLDLDEMAYPSRSPMPGVKTSSGFGLRRDPFTGRPARHTGIDYPAWWGTPILASAGGRVRYAGPRGSYGKTVEIDHGDGLVTRYGHASKILVRVGDILLPGQLIATVGSTGRSTGPHLHFEILRDGIPVPPGPYLAGDDS